MSHTSEGLKVSSASIQAVIVSVMELQGKWQLTRWALENCDCLVSSIGGEGGHYSGCSVRVAELLKMLQGFIFWICRPVRV